MYFLKSRDDILSNQADIEAHFLQFYKQLYALHNVSSEPELVSRVIP